MSNADRNELNEKLLKLLTITGKFGMFIAKDQLNLAYESGMLKKEQLEDGKYYYGHCRNATVARWNSTTQKFTYMRSKFGSIFPEDINHPEDDNKYDLFIPVGECNPTNDEIIRRFNV